MSFNFKNRRITAAGVIAALQIYFVEVFPVLVVYIFFKAVWKSSIKMISWIPSICNKNVLPKLEFVFSSSILVQDIWLGLGKFMTGY